MRIGIFGGGFKPFTTGHYSKLALADEENDRVFLYYSTSARKKGSSFDYDEATAIEIFNIVSRAIQREMPKVRVVRATVPPLTLVFSTIAEAFGLPHVTPIDLGIPRSMVETVTVYGDPDSLLDYTRHVGTPKEERYFGTAVKDGRLIFDDGLDVKGRGTFDRMVTAMKRTMSTIEPAEIEQRARVRGSYVRSAAAQGLFSEVKKFMPPFLNDGEVEAVINIMRDAMKDDVTKVNEADERWLRATVRKMLLEGVSVTDRPLYKIAEEIYDSWKPVSPHARPYLGAMTSLSDLDDRYGADDAEEIVIRFLSNASTWRGPEAKRIKLELNGMLKRYQHKKYQT